MRLKGKVALVSGAGRGIGAAIAEAFLAEGAFVCLTDLDDAPGVQFAARLGPSATYRHLDVNVSSRSGLVGIPAGAAYAASKAAVRNHTKTVALYCAEQGLDIRCNSIHPAAILTPMWEPLLGQGPEREARMRALVRDTPLKRFGTPQEVAAVAVLLASDEAAYMTGAELTIDGGILAGSAALPTGDGDDH